MTKPPILVIPRGLDFLTPTLEDQYRIVRAWQEPSIDDLHQVRAIICLGSQSLDQFVAQLPQLGLVACFTTGYEAIDVGALNGRGILVTHAPGATAAPVAEFALALILAARRNVVRGDRLVMAGEWREGGIPPIGRSVQGAAIGVVGLGAIGLALARLCQALGMTVSWWGPHEKPDAAWPRASSLQALARDCDILAVCASASAQSVRLISSEVIDALGPDGLLVNVARGQLVDEDALIEALRAGRLGGAALDVFATEPTPAERWVGVPNLICTPHIAGATRENLDRLTAMMRANLDAFFANGRPPNLARPSVQ